MQTDNEMITQGGRAGESKCGAVKVLSSASGGCICFFQ